MRLHSTKMFPQNYIEIEKEAGSRHSHSTVLCFSFAMKLVTSAHCFKNSTSIMNFGTLRL